MNTAETNGHNSRLLIYLIFATSLSLSSLARFIYSPSGSILINIAAVSAVLLIIVITLEIVIRLRNKMAATFSLSSMVLMVSAAVLVLIGAIILTLFLPN